MKELLAALNELQEDVQFIKAKRNNDFTKSKFAKFIDVVYELRDPLKKHGLVVDQNITHENGEDLLETIVYHTESSQSKTSRTKLVNSSEILKWGASVTYQRRYALLVILGLITDGDDDGQLSDAKANSRYVEDVETQIAKATTIRQLATIFNTMPVQQRIDTTKAFTARKLELSNATAN